MLIAHCIFNDQDQYQDKKKEALTIVASSIVQFMAIS